MPNRNTEPIVMTDRELYNNLQFKLLQKLLIKRFPWVTKLEIPTNIGINQYSAVIFMDVYLDLKKLKDFYDAEYSDYVSYFLSRGDFGHSVVFQDGFHYMDSVIKKFEGDDEIKFNEKLNEILESLNHSPIIPDDQILPKSIRLNQYKVDPTSSV